MRNLFWFVIALVSESLSFAHATEIILKGIACCLQAGWSTSVVASEFNVSHQYWESNQENQIHNNQLQPNNISYIQPLMPYW